MAAYDPYTVAPGVQRNDCDWGYSLEGTKDNLLASGLVKPHWFIEPNMEDGHGRTVRSKRLVDDGRNIETTLPARGFAFVRVYNMGERSNSNLRPAVIHEAPTRVAGLPLDHRTNHHAAFDAFLMMATGEHARIVCNKELLATARAEVRALYSDRPDGDSSPR